jgi:putative copper resistance protein D
MSLHTLSVFFHVLAAVVWAGGMLFLGPIAAPALRGLEPPEARARAFLAVGRRFRPVGWACIAVLVATGFTNLLGLGLNPLTDPGFLLRPPFGHVLLTKLALVAVAIVLSALHDFVWGPRAFTPGPPTPEKERYRRRAIAVARANSLVVVVILFLGVALRH